MPPTVTDDNISSERPKRIRRTPEMSRRVALDAAQALLLADGPTAVTLKAVAKATGMTHGNVTHHFGTSAALHAALIDRMANDLVGQAQAAVERLRLGQIGAEEVVDVVFAAFGATGCGRLIGWLSATGQQDALAPVFSALQASIRSFRAGEPETTVGAEAGAGPIALGLLSHALTASLIGQPLEAAADMPAGSLRRLATLQLRALRATA